MADREIHTTTTGGSSGIGILGVIVGALLVLGVVFFFAGGPNWFGTSGGGSTEVTVKQSGPSTPATPKSSGSTTTTGSAPAKSEPAPKQ